MPGVAMVLGQCFVHKGLFYFDAEWVTSALIDPVTGLAADDPAADPSRARREPICPDCCRQINPLRIARGLEPLDERDSLERVIEESR